jgi:hypothetical protein
MIPLQQIVSRLEAVKVKHGIEPALKEIACEFQAGNIAFQLEPAMSTPSDIPIAFVTYSKEWESRYRDQGYLEIDPVRAASADHCRSIGKQWPVRRRNVGSFGKPRASVSVVRVSLSPYGERAIYAP